VLYNNNNQDAMGKLQKQRSAPVAFFSREVVVHQGINDDGGYI